MNSLGPALTLQIKQVNKPFVGGKPMDSKEVKLRFEYFSHFNPKMIKYLQSMERGILHMQSRKIQYNFY